MAATSRVRPSCPYNCQPIAGPSGGGSAEVGCTPVGLSPSPPRSGSLVPNQMQSLGKCGPLWSPNPQVVRGFVGHYSKAHHTLLLTQWPGPCAGTPVHQALLSLAWGPNLARGPNLAPWVRETTEKVPGPSPDTGGSHVVPNPSPQSGVVPTKIAPGTKGQGEGLYQCVLPRGPQDPGSRKRWNLFRKFPFRQKQLREGRCRSR